MISECPFCKEKRPWHIATCPVMAVPNFAREHVMESYLERAKLNEKATPEGKMTSRDKAELICLVIGSIMVGIATGSFSAAVATFFLVPLLSPGSYKPKDGKKE